MNNAVIVGAGVGGLTTAALLARAGWQVTVLEAHVYPGGSAGTFYHQGFRFDAGATLAGGFGPQGPMTSLAEALGIEWPARHENPTMRVYLPNGRQVDRFTDERRWQERIEAFGPESERFWRWQEATADAVWSLADKNPAWPPQSIPQALSLTRSAMAWLAEAETRSQLPGLAFDGLQTVSHHLREAPEALRLFVDAQLQISAQTTSERANALYGAGALDLPRRGVVTMAGGMGQIAEELVEAVRRHGGEVLYRKEVTRIQRLPDGTWQLDTRRGEKFAGQTVILNLPPANIARLMEPVVPPALRQDRSPYPADGWGAFMVYAGLDESALPADLPLHNQVIAGRPFGEGNTVFISLSPEWDLNRAPLKKRAVTLSTHTALDPWWSLYEHDREGYAARKEAVTARMLETAGRVLPGIAQAAEILLPGTPVTFQRFTRRIGGWVGGYPQTSLFRTRGPWLGQELWMVGDSIFPGQSVTAVALGGRRVADLILQRARLSNIRNWLVKSPDRRTLAPGYARIRDDSRYGNLD